MFIAALFTIAKTWNTTTQSLKNNEMIPSATTQMDLEIIIPCEGSQEEKDKYQMMSFTCGI